MPSRAESRWMASRSWSLQVRPLPTDQAAPSCFVTQLRLSKSPASTSTSRCSIPPVGCGREARIRKTRRALAPIVWTTSSTTRASKFARGSGTSSDTNSLSTLVLMVIQRHITPLWVQ